MVFGAGVLDLNSKKNAAEMFEKNDQSSQKPHRNETQSLILQGLPNQSHSMTDSSASQIHQTFKKIDLCIVCCTMFSNIRQ